MWLTPSQLSRSAPAEAASSSGCPSSCEHVWLPSLSGIPSPRPCSWLGWKTRAWSRRLFGAVTLPSWTPPPSGASTSSPPGSPAPRSAPPGADRAPTMPVGSGPPSPGWFATLAHASCSSKTCRACWYQPQASLLDSGTFSATWPASGSMRSGVAYERPTLVPPTNATGSSSWPTATAANSSGNGYTRDKGDAAMWPTPMATPYGSSQNGVNSSRPSAGTPSLEGQARMWPTPKTPSGGAEARAARGSGGEDLAATVQSWSTPTAYDAKATAPSQLERKTPTLVEQSGTWASGPPAPTTTTDGDEPSPLAVLNPPFVEALQGWPLGWSDCGASVTAASLRRWRERSVSLLVERGFCEG